jgi:hypothetical protein
MTSNLTVINSVNDRFYDVTMSVIGQTIDGGFSSYDGNNVSVGMWFSNR